MTNLPRLELTEDPNKNNEYIIYRHSINGKKMNKQNKTVNNKISNSKTVLTKKPRKYGTKKKRTRKSRKGFFNIF